MINNVARFFRAVIVRVTPGKLPLADFKGNGENHRAKELWQHYAFTSRPKKGMEALCFRIFGWVVVLATDDRAHRPALDDGEAALWTDEGDMIKLKRGRIVEIIAGTKVTVTAPMVEFSGDVKINGKLDVTGLVTALGGITALGGVSTAGAPSGGAVTDAAGTLAAARAAFNTHTHTDPQGGTTGPATPQM